MPISSTFIDLGSQMKNLNANNQFDKSVALCEDQAEQEKR